MKVRLACVDDLNEIMELYHLVSDMMECVSRGMTRAEREYRMF